MENWHRSGMIKKDVQCYLPFALELRGTVKSWIARKKMQSGNHEW
jgi:hypothetical protein